MKNEQGYGVPKKIRELKRMLLKAGCTCEKAKGSHTKWMHPKCANRLILSGNDGSDAKPYQENNVLSYLQGIQEEK